MWHWKFPFEQWVPREVTGPITHATYSCDSQSIFVSFEDASVGVLSAYTLRWRCRINPTSYLPANPRWLNTAAFLCLFQKLFEKKTQKIWNALAVFLILFGLFSKFVLQCKGASTCYRCTSIWPESVCIGTQRWCCNCTWAAWGWR